MLSIIEHAAIENLLFRPSMKDAMSLVEGEMHTVMLYRRVENCRTVYYNSDGSVVWSKHCSGIMCMRPVDIVVMHVWCVWVRHYTTVSPAYCGIV